MYKSKTCLRQRLSISRSSRLRRPTAPRRRYGISVRPSIHFLRRERGIAECSLEILKGCLFSNKCECNLKRASFMMCTDKIALRSSFRSLQTVSPFLKDLFDVRTLCRDRKEGCSAILSVDVIKEAHAESSI